MNFTSFFFILEALMKIISMGLFKHKNAYLRDGWNIVDFIVVLSSMVELIITSLVKGNLPSLKMLRALRVIRPLRSVKRVPSMRRLVSIMLRSLPELGNTLVFMMFFFVVFGIIGIQTFYGVIYQKCRLPEVQPNGNRLIDETQSDFICTKSDGEWNSCREGTVCWSPLEDPLLDPEMDNPWEDENINFNTINFNNLLNAMVTIFEALTLEGWSFQMNQLIDTGNPTLSIIFYLILITFGSYFILNLILAVIMGSFTKFENQEIEDKIKMAEQAELLKVKRSVIDDDHNNELSPEKINEQIKRRMSM